MTDHLKEVTPEIILCPFESEILQILVLINKEDCWLYGQRRPLLHRHDKNYNLSKIVYKFIKKINVPDELRLITTCKNLNCINPEHKKIVLHSCQKLTLKQMIHIKYDMPKEMPNDVIADVYNVSKDMICKLRNGTTWQNI